MRVANRKNLTYGPVRLNRETGNEAVQTMTYTIPVNDHGMALYLALPDAAGPFSAVVVIQHAPGLDTFTHSMVHRLAEAGYAAAAPDLYHRLDAQLAGPDKRKQLKDPEIIQDVGATVDFLRAHPSIDSARLGITGFCMGGRVVYLVIAANPHFRAAVAYYGGDIMLPWGEGVDAPFAHTADIHCPLLFHFGNEDSNPSSQDMLKLDEALTRHGKLHKFHAYKGAGHAFMNFTDADRYHEDAARISWTRTLRFFERYL